jgi:ESF2/ABP1 family protein
MATRRKNEWLDDSSDDEDAGYDSDFSESRAKSVASRSVKRRRVDRSDSEAESEQSEEDTEHPKEEARLSYARANKQAKEEGLDEPSKSPQPGDTQTPRTTKSEPSLAKKLAKSLKKTSNTGVIYISRVPPFMKPHTLKRLLEPYGPSGIGRLFLTPETSSAHTSRVRSGGNKKRNFSDGWVEFLSKREAKIACETLNTTIIGGKKGGYYHDDVWNLKYLKGFKWRNLTEQIANENAERAARLRAEGQKERREVREYVRNVERAKMLDGMEKKKKRKDEASSGNAEETQAHDGKPVSKSGYRPEKRQFQQVEVISRVKRDAADQPDEVKRVLSKIF